MVSEITSSLVSGSCLEFFPDFPQWWSMAWKWTLKSIFKMPYHSDKRELSILIPWQANNQSKEGDCSWVCPPVVFQSWECAGSSGYTIILFQLYFSQLPFVFCCRLLNACYVCSISQSCCSQSPLHKMLITYPFHLSRSKFYPLSLRPSTNQLQSVFYSRKAIRWVIIME